MTTVVALRFGGASEFAIQVRVATESIAVRYSAATSIAIGAGDDQIASSLEDSLLATTATGKKGGQAHRPE